MHNKINFYYFIIDFDAFVPLLETSFLLYLNKK